MNLRRILQLALTSFVGQGISIITQLLIPPFFLRFYPSGIQVYGEWIALSCLHQLSWNPQLRHPDLQPTTR